MTTTTMQATDRKAAYEQTIRTYFDGCNEADLEKMTACFTEDAVHYFPPGMYEGPWRGGRKIAEMWVHLVATIGSAWSIDRLIVDPESHQAAIEWTHYKTSDGKMLRGDEWYLFDEATGLIKEIRAYYASPQAPGLTTLELEGFDYAGRGYHLQCPVPRPHPSQATA